MTSKRVLLLRKPTAQKHIDIGMYYLPENEVTPFVTWRINTSIKEITGEEYTALGHYHREFVDAYEDYWERD